jgi:hypothetical protein
VNLEGDDDEKKRHEARMPKQVHHVTFSDWKWCEENTTDIPRPIASATLSHLFPVVARANCSMQSHSKVAAAPRLLWKVHDLFLLFSFSYIVLTFFRP